MEKLNLEGWAIIEGLNIPTDTSVSKKLIFTDKMVRVMNII